MWSILVTRRNTVGEEGIFEKIVLNSIIRRDKRKIRLWCLAGADPRLLLLTLEEVESSSFLLNISGVFLYRLSWCLELLFLKHE